MLPIGEYAAHTLQVRTLISCIITFLLMLDPFRFQSSKALPLSTDLGREVKELLAHLITLLCVTASIPVCQFFPFYSYHSNQFAKDYILISSVIS